VSGQGALVDSLPGPAGAWPGSATVLAAACAGVAVALVPRPQPIVSPTTRVVPVGLVLGLAGVVLSAAPRAGGLVVVGIAAACAVLLLVRAQRARKVALGTSARVQGLCEDLAGELAAGLPVPAALDAAAGRWPDLDEVALAHRLGGSVPDALRQVARRPGAGDLRLVAAAWQVSERSGAGLSLALQSVARSLGERQRTRRLVASELASARSTARLMAGLPVFTLLMGAGAGGDPVGFLLGTTPGLACLAAGVACELAGLAWIERIASSVEADT